MRASKKMLIRQVVFENESGISIKSKQISNPYNIEKIDFRGLANILQLKFQSVSTNDFCFYYRLNFVRVALFRKLKKVILTFVSLIRKF